jgi:hypothetical protein
MPDDPDQKSRELDPALKRYFGLNERRTARGLARKFLLGAAWAAVLAPLLFYLQAGEVSAFGWGFTVFLVALCLLVALGFYFADKPAYHTEVEYKNDGLDKIGGLWLMACAMGPFFGWLAANLFTLTETNWRRAYLARAFLSVGLPVVTGLPLLRYARGKAAPLVVALLLAVTALPALSCYWTLRDLRAGTITQTIPYKGRNAAVTSLPYTKKVVKIEPQ